MTLNHGFFSYPDRRAKPRMNCNYPAVIKGHDIQENCYELTAKVVNLSSCGIYVWVFKPIMVNTEVAVTIAFPTGSLNLESSRLTAHGLVVRCDQRSEGAFGVAVKFNHYRFI